MKNRALIRVTKSGHLSISEEEIKHLVKVRRLRPDDPFLGLDGAGRSFQCRLVRGSQGWEVSMEQEIDQLTESPFQTTLGQALIRLDRFEWVLQKASELGVSRIVPLTSVRTEVRLQKEKFDSKRQRWERILIESMKQSGRTMLPVLEPPSSLEDFLTRDTSSCRLALDEAGDVDLHDILERERPESGSVVVGPEGGWDERDRELLRRFEVPGVRLGPRILRAETAPAAILAILQFAWGDLNSGTSDNRIRGS